MKLNFFLLLWRPGAPRAQMPQMRDKKEATWRQHGGNMEPTWSPNGAPDPPRCPPDDPEKIQMSVYVLLFVIHIGDFIPFSLARSWSGAFVL